MADGHGAGPSAKFTQMLDGTQEDWDIIAKNARAFNKGLAKRVLDHLRLLDGDFGGYPIDRLEPCVTEDDDRDDHQNAEDQR